MRLSLNLPLLWLALIGITLYAGVNIIAGKIDPEAHAAADGRRTATKQAAAEAALAFAKERFGLSPAAGTFVTYETYKLRSSYLERYGLAAQYDKKFGKDYPLEYFTVELRGKQESSAAHWFVDVDMSGRRVLGWSEGADAARQRPAKVDLAKAEAAALRTLRDRGYDPALFTPVRAPQDPDTRFTFESKTDRVGEAKLQLQIDADETRAFGFASVFVIPLEHVHWMENQDRQASIMTWISLGFMLLMAAAGFIYAVLYRKHVSFGRGVVLTLVYAAFYCLNNLNMLPALKAGQGSGASTQDTIINVMFVNFVTLLMAIGVYISYVSGMELWRRVGWNPWPRWREARFGADVWHSMGRGYLLCLFVLGVQQLLFFAAMYGFRVWTVSDASDSPYNMLVPGLFPLLAWCAAISEESTFRLFGIAFFARIVRWRFAAVLLPSIVWAAIHTQYPIYPVYTRLIEVTILGLILGYAFLKYGFMTVLFAHASMDSLLMGFDLLSLQNAADAALGILYMAAPLLVGTLLAWLHGRSRRRSAPLAG
ncbi:hypothetical protein SD70_08180 [Gordoniibacillus kamchatkensis]|uniref:CAAX prenyl protease 2/Lysostaphin resistance protein A-like domain-containing protein n=1 Tax=Gordoniibacillus kamchatkensis TaxID=1590651 RepID=A0ABR5AJN4_9BACL|nr:CPBP family intramembrane glutamic endopeptidase [Paenibacillus sp. VKM B-2647]KIL41229.1 hypothetical protein SD70_08180 [Paenibacillus sp. VKM B-2647]